MPRCTSLAVPYVASDSKLLSLFFGTALFWMLLPGTLLAVLAVSGIEGATSAGWIQAHAHAQLFGWLGTAILGVTLYAVPRLRRITVPPSAGVAAWLLWNAGVAMRWIGAMSAVPQLLPLSAACELAAAMLVISVVLRGGSPDAAAGRSLSLIWFTLACVMATAVMNVVACWIAAAHNSPLVPSAWNQRVITVAIWGAIVSSIFAYTIRWVAQMLTLRRSWPRLTGAAFLLIAASLVAYELSPVVAAVLRGLAVLSFVAGIRIFEPYEREPKVRGVSAATPFFTRAAFAWLLIATTFDIAAAAGWLWFASAARHTLALGFVASMMLVVAPRFLPSFFGAKLLYSARLMTLSLVIHHIAVLVRATTELGVVGDYGRGLFIASGSANLLALALFATNMLLTMRNGVREHTLRAAAVPESSGSEVMQQQSDKRNLTTANS